MCIQILGHLDDPFGGENVVPFPMNIIATFLLAVWIDTLHANQEYCTPHVSEIVDTSTPKEHYKYWLIVILFNCMIWIPFTTQYSSHVNDRLNHQFMLNVVKITGNNKAPVLIAYS